MDTFCTKNIVAMEVKPLATNFVTCDVTQGFRFSMINLMMKLMIAKNIKLQSKPNSYHRQLPISSFWANYALGSSLQRAGSHPFQFSTVYTVVEYGHNISCTNQYSLCSTNCVNCTKYTRFGREDKAWLPAGCPNPGHSLPRKVISIIIAVNIWYALIFNNFCN